MKKLKLDEALVLNQSEYTKDEYKFISQLIWGCVPVERPFAEGTNIFKTNAKLILAKYPKLDKSFFSK